MKRNPVLLAIFALLMFASCDNSVENSYNEFGIYPLVNGSRTIYADQTVDSFTVVSNLIWSATVTEEWLSLNPSYSSRTQSGASVIETRCPIYFSENTTGATRTGYLQGANADGHKVGRIYIQTYWLNITSPEVSFADAETYSDATFTKTLAADSTSTTIDFTIYAETATLTTDATWIQFGESNFTQGTYSVPLTFPVNTTGVERRAEFTLKTSNGISNKVTIVQKKA